MVQRQVILVVLVALLALTWIPLVFALPYEDFTAFTEVDEAANLTIVNSTYVELYAERHEYAYLYDDYGNDYFDDFTHYIDVYLNDSESSSSLATVWLLLLGNGKPADPAADSYDLRFGGYSYLDINFLQNIAIFQLRLGYYNGAAYSADDFTCVKDKWYYLNITRTDTLIQCEIYDNSTERTLGINELDILSRNVATTAGRYLYACSTFDNNLGATYSMNVSIANLDIAPIPTYSYLTMYHTAGGTVRRNNATYANGTESQHVNNTLITFELIAIVQGNMTYGFANFSWNGHYNISNPYTFNYTIHANTTLWTYFEAITTASGIGIERKWVGVMFLGFFIALPIIVLLKKRG